MTKERQVIINEKTYILTTSEESDEVVRERYLYKLEHNKQTLKNMNNMGKQSFKKTKDKYEDN